MLAASCIVDPLIGSPQRARNHDSDMAALQLMMELPPLELPPSVVSVAASSEDAGCEEGTPAALESGGGSRGLDETADGADEDTDCAFQKMMNRGHFLRQLRLLALADEQERLQAQSSDACPSIGEEKKEDLDDTADRPLATEELEDRVTVLPNGDRVLDYDSYLAHQRYYDDLKHIDMKYMDFGTISNINGEDCGRLVVEQRKRLGKGGLCWDAGFMLGEHVIAHEAEWNVMSGAASDPPRIVELGAGTGITGLMIAKATQSTVTVTDLPELEGLMQNNVRRNFNGIGEEAADEHSNLLTARDDKSKGTISARTLRWGVEADYDGAPYDIIAGADIVTSLYDPVALARTIHALSGPDTRIYLSGKARLDRPHEEFDAEMHRLFERVERIAPQSRLRSPDVFIIAAEGKR